jgi:hypothetical protein
MPKAPRPGNLKAALDRGAGRDKVVIEDPAAAPLGTDEEAAGTPIPPAAVRLALNYEIRGQAEPKREGHEPFFPSRTIAAVFLLLLALAATAAVYFRS